MARPRGMGSLPRPHPTSGSSADPRRMLRKTTTATRQARMRGRDDADDEADAQGETEASRRPASGLGAPGARAGRSSAPAYPGRGEVVVWHGCPLGALSVGDGRSARADRSGVSGSASRGGCSGTQRPCVAPSGGSGGAGSSIAIGILGAGPSMAGPSMGRPPGRCASSMARQGTTSTWYSIQAATFRPRRGGVGKGPCLGSIMTQASAA